MSLLLLFLPTGTAAHTGSAGITLQDVTLTATGVATILGTLSITLDNITLSTVYISKFGSDPIPRALREKREQQERFKEEIYKLEKAKEMNEVRILQDKLKEEQRTSQALAQAMLIAEGRSRAKEQEQIQAIEGVKGAISQIPIVLPQNLQRLAKNMEALQKANEAREARKKAEEDRRKQQLKNLAKARKVKAKKNK